MTEKEINIESAAYVADLVHECGVDFESAIEQGFYYKKRLEKQFGVTMHERHASVSSHKGE